MIKWNINHNYNNIMRKPNPNLTQLKLEFYSKHILTMTDIKKILGTNVNMTAYRILSNFSYISSYSHAGRYYTLPEIAQFDEHGIWEYSRVYFSQYITLKESILNMLNQSTTGYSANELKGLFKVSVYNTVLNLYKQNQIKREQIGNEYIYFSVSKHAQQFHQRRSEAMDYFCSAYDDYLSLFISTLNEKQKRWFAGLQSIKLGYGGDKIIAQKFDMDAKTVAKGRVELEASDIDMSRIRTAGAGRPSIKKTLKS
jgi:hypothetical protein